MSTRKYWLPPLAVLGSYLFLGCAGTSSGISSTTPGPAPVTQSTYVIADTGQSRSFNAATEISPPAAGQPFCGQDAQFSGTQPSYTRSSDGLTVKDNVTGLTWQQNFHTRPLYWTKAREVPAALNAARYGGYSDWRLPTIKELYSLWNSSAGWPYIDRTFFAYDPQGVPHTIFWSGNKYSGLLDEKTDAGSLVGAAELAFGVNFDTGHIKAYSTDVGPKHLVRCVRGDIYGVNAFRDNNDGTITDQATGLMWAKNDSGSGMDWEHALAFAQTRNAANYLGHNDWRLPNTKELQNIVDYSRSPGATDPARVGPAIDPLFNCTAITNEAGKADSPYYWTSTTVMPEPRRGMGPRRSAPSTSEPLPSGGAAYIHAWYVAFGRAVDVSGYDLHGAGAVRFDQKITGGPARQDAERVDNYVRLVRNAK